MTTDPDLERDLERLMSRVKLPDSDQWVPAATQARRAPWAAIAGTAAAALLLAVAIGVVARPSDPATATATPLEFRGPATLRVGVLVPDEAVMVAADDGALAHVRRAPDGTTTLYVTDLRTGERRTIATTPGRLIWLEPGALRRDLVTYVEEEVPQPRATAPGRPLPVIWHVMVANWRSGATPKEFEAIPGEVGPGTAKEMPDPVTNGNEVVWRHAPRVSGVLGNVWIWRSDGNSSSVVLLGEARYAIDDGGRVAVSRSVDVANTSWDLILYEANGSARRLVMGREQDGLPYVAGPKIVWPRYGSGNVTSVDVIDIASGSVQSVAPVNCSFIGATVKDLVFVCGAGTRLYPIGGATVVDLTSVSMARVVQAEAHAITGRDTAAITVTPVP
jgi:hypothetical protein